MVEPGDSIIRTAGPCALDARLQRIPVEAGAGHLGWRSPSAHSGRWTTRMRSSGALASLPATVGEVVPTDCRKSADQVYSADDLRYHL